MSFKKDFQSLSYALNKAIKHKISINDKKDDDVLNYDQSQKQYYKKNLEKSIQNILNQNILLSKIEPGSAIGQKKLNEIIQLIPNLESKNLKNLQNTVKKIEELMEFINFPEVKNESIAKIPSNIPTDIKSDILLDLREIDKCFFSECYRSSVILCGRVLETVLHRKYYEATGHDILEKNPGIGLGNLISKLKDKNVNLDPAIANQIHLINQVRVFSVHKKKEAFNPTKDQTKAIILYTIDILNKIF